VRRALAIVEKDARHLWPHISAYVVLLVLAAWLDAAYTPRDPMAYNIVSTILPIACWFLIVALIQEEEIPGDRQYWLTRPIARQDLVGAKALFVAAFVQLPLVLSHVGVMAALGIPPSAHLSTLLWKQIFFFAFYVLPAAAIAAITRNIGQVLLTGLALFLPAIGLEGLMMRLRLALGGAEWMLSAAIGVVALAGALAIFAIQYGSRRTVLARVAAGIAVLSTVGASALPLDRLHQTSNTLRIAMDPAQSPSAVSLGVGRNRSPVEVPVVVAGLGDQSDFVNATMAIEVSGPGIPAWRAQFREGGLHHLQNGRGWMTLPIDTDLIRLARTATVDLKGTLELELFGERQVYPPPVDTKAAVDRVGVCRRGTDSLGSLAIVCY